MADFLQVFFVMGFSVGCYGLGIARLLFHLAFMFFYIKTAICWALHFLRLADFEEHDSDSSDWQDLRNINSSSVPSVSADTIRDNLPAVTFGQFLRRFSEPTGDNDMCSACLSSFEAEEQIRELCNCCHIFHRNCLDKWLDHHQTTCPLCRSSLIVLLSSIIIKYSVRHSLTRD